MKESELRKHTTCDLCHRKLGQTELPLFWIVTVQRFGLDINAMKRQDGLGQFLGSSILAGVMGPNEDMAKPVMELVKLTVCEMCAQQSEVLMHALSKPQPLEMAGAEDMAQGGSR